MRALPTIARDQCGVFSTQQALRSGWTHPALRHATITGQIHRVRIGAYQIADLTLLDIRNDFEQARWRHAAQAIGAVLTTSGAAASHSTAAVLRGIPLIFIPPEPCATVASWYTGEIPYVHLHRCPSRAPAAMRAIKCTTVERTGIDLAREHGVAAGVAALDFALHQNLITVNDVYAELSQCARWPGVRAAREAVALADGRSESVLESRSRMKLREFGLPEPDLQVRIGNEWGGFVARVDFYWDEFGVVGEADGAMKYDGTDPAPLLAEKNRQAAMDDLELPVVRWGTADLREFAPVATRLRRAFTRGRRQPRGERRWTILPPP